MLTPSEILTYLQETPKASFGYFYEDEEKFLKEVVSYLCQGDKDKEAILKEYVAAHIRNAEYGVAFENAGESQ